jgi:hypothetical protein
MVTPFINPEPKDITPLETRDNVFELSFWSAVDGKELEPEIEAVERYFGGSSYSADPKTREIICDAVRHACRIVSPLMAFSVKAIQSADTDGTLTLSSGEILPVPDCLCNLTARFLTAAIGTLGKELETECRFLAAQHHIFQSTLLDAVGTAMLDVLDTKIRTTIDTEHRFQGFFSGVRFAPGLNGYPLEHQQILFQLADGLSVDVRLNEAFMMEPVKTISFFSLIGCQKMENQQPDKCLKCRMPRCQFRKGQPTNSDAAMDRIR